MQGKASQINVLRTTTTPEGEYSPSLVKHSYWLIFSVIKKAIGQFEYDLSQSYARKFNHAALSTKALSENLRLFGRNKCWKM